MNKLKITGSTPLSCTGLVHGDYYLIENGTQTKVGQLISATILNIIFRIYVSDGRVVYDELKLPTISLIDSPVTLTHIGDNLPVNQLAELICEIPKDEMM
jgi:hypothetical protein